MCESVDGVRLSTSSRYQDATTGRRDKARSSEQAHMTSSLDDWYNGCYRYKMVEVMVHRTTAFDVAHVVQVGSHQGQLATGRK